MEIEKLLSIITVNYNGLKDTCELMESLPLNDESLEVIMVDNASKEDEASVIAQRFPQVKVIRSKQNLGFAGGNNLGIQTARGKYLFFINNDTLLEVKGQRSKDRGQRSKVKGQRSKDKGQRTEVKGQGVEVNDVFQPLIERLESSEKIGMACPKIRFSWGNQPIQYTGYTRLSSITLRNHPIGYGEEDHGQYDKPHITPYAHGAAMMVKREVIEKAGMMPECYFLYYEELDWSMMIRRAGYEIWYEPACTIYHKESQTTGQQSPLRGYYITRNRLLFAKRNIKGGTLLLSYLYLIGIVAPKDIFKYFFQGRFDLCKATIKGIIHFIKL